MRKPSILDRFLKPKPRVEVNPFTDQAEAVVKPLEVEKVNLTVADKTWLESHVDGIVKGVGFLVLLYNLIMAVMYAVSLNLAFMFLFGLSAYYILGYLKLVGKR